MCDSNAVWWCMAGLASFGLLSCRRLVETYHLRFEFHSRHYNLYIFVMYEVLLGAWWAINLCCVLWVKAWWNWLCWNGLGLAFPASLVTLCVDTLLLTRMGSLRTSAYGRIDEWRVDSKVWPWSHRTGLETYGMFRIHCRYWQFLYLRDVWGVTRCV